jgi:hypothetical protein
MDGAHAIISSEMTSWHYHARDEKQSYLLKRLADLNDYHLD